MSKFSVVASIVVLSITTGCASVTGSKMQSVSVQTVQDSKEVAGIGCVLTNDAGKWFVTTPGSVTVQKSTADLSVDCNKEGVGTGHENAVSKANGGAWGNILLGGPIGYVVDRSSGAGFDYPQTITVILKKIEHAMGIDEKTDKTSNQSIAQTQPKSQTAQ